MNTTVNLKFWTILSFSLLVVSVIALTFSNAPFIAANLGLSSGASLTLAKTLDSVSSVATALSIIGVFTGVGTIGSALTATILAVIKKKGVAKGAAF